MSDLYNTVSESSKEGNDNSIDTATPNAKRANTIKKYKQYQKDLEKLINLSKQTVYTQHQKLTELKIQHRKQQNLTNATPQEKQSPPKKPEEPRKQNIQETLKNLTKDLSYIQLQLDTAAQTIDKLINTLILQNAIKTIKTPPSTNIKPKPPPPTHPSTNNQTQNKLNYQ